MTWKDYWDCPEEIFIGACLQFPLYFVVGWWVLPIMVVCGLLWRLGGVTGGSKLMRRIVIPTIVCTSAFICGSRWTIFCAIPFMVWIAPSYGEKSWIFKLTKNDLVTRLICYAWYWIAFSLSMI